MTTRACVVLYSYIIVLRVRVMCVDDDDETHAIAHFEFVYNIKRRLRKQ